MLRRPIAVCLLAAGTLTNAGAAREADPLKELDAKVAKALERETFSQASRDFVKALSDEYQAAWRRNEQTMDWHGSGAKATAPQIQSYQDYVGAYGRGGRPFLQVTTDAAGRFLVTLEGHTIPAVAVNRAILLTTGDVVRAPTLPRLGPKPHATLEFFTLTRRQGRYLFTAPGAPPSRAMPLEKLP